MDVTSKAFIPSKRGSSVKKAEGDFNATGSTASFSPAVQSES
jgi:hypothetical protein